MKHHRHAEDYLPLTPAVLHILLALADEDRHGLGIMAEVEDRTSGEVQLGPGTLYGSIKRMLEAGLIHETLDRPAPEDDDTRRRYYAVTPMGAEVLRLEAERLKSLVGVAREKKVIG